MEMREIRTRMLKDQPVNECEACRDQDARGLATMRQMYNKDYFEKITNRIEDALKNEGRLTAPPLLWDLSTGNICNLACRICSPTNSSRIDSELKQNSDRLSPPLQHLADDWNGKRIIYENEPDYFKSMVLKHSDAIEELKFQGGEPTVLNTFWETLEALVEKDVASKIRLLMFTNVTRIDSEKIKILNQFKSGYLFCSIDAYGEENDFLRYPSKWSAIEDNLQKLYHLEGKWKITLKSAISHYNCLTYDKLLFWAEDFFKKHLPRADFSVHDVVFPDHLRADLVPRALRLEAFEKIQKLMSGSWLLNESPMKNGSLNGMNELERILKMPDMEEPKAKRLRKVARIAIDNFDLIRQQEAHAIFPHLKEIF